MIAAGIIDPTKVVRIALQNSASVAGLLLTTQGLVCEIKEEKEAMPAMPPAAAACINRYLLNEKGPRYAGPLFFCLILVVGI